VLVASEQNSILVQRWWQQGSQWAMVRMHIIVFFLIFDLVLVDLGVFVGKGSGNRGKACMLREM
jgi:hypothetical protein